MSTAFDWTYRTSESGTLGDGLITYSESSTNSIVVLARENEMRAVYSATLTITGGFENESYYVSRKSPTLMPTPTSISSTTQEMSTPSRETPSATPSSTPSSEEGAVESSGVAETTESGCRVGMSPRWLMAGGVLGVVGLVL